MDIKTYMMLFNVKSCMSDEDEEMGWLTAIGFGVVAVLLGGWLALNGGGACVALRFANTCLIGGQSFGLVLFLLGLLGLWVGYDEFQKGGDAI